MQTVDLFDKLAVSFEHCGPDASDRAQPEAGAKARHGRQRRKTPLRGAGGKHYRLAMRAARQLGSEGERTQTTRLICHHLRCMLDEGDLRPRRARV